MAVPPLYFYAQVKRILIDLQLAWPNSGKNPHSIAKDMQLLRDLYDEHMQLNPRDMGTEVHAVRAHLQAILWAWDHFVVLDVDEAEGALLAMPSGIPA